MLGGLESVLSARRINGYIVAEDGSPDLDEQALARYREMGVDELAGFIKDALGRIDEPDPDRERPHDYEEFLAAWRVLRRKSDEMPPDPAPPLTPLDKAYDKRERNLRFLHGRAPGKERPDRKQQQRVQRELARLDLEIERMEDSGKYDDAPASDPNTPQRAAARTASEVFREIEGAFEHLPRGKRRLQWRPARPGSLSVGSIRRYCEERQRRDPDFRYDMGRIENAEALGPDGPPWEGPDGFDGYAIYTYRTKRALMECPEVGNAAYVIHKDWESWSKMDKQELMAEAERGGDVTRIEHRGDDWPEEVGQALGLG
jgi:hypothetical protein